MPTSHRKRHIDEEMAKHRSLPKRPRADDDDCSEEGQIEVESSAKRIRMMSPVSPPVSSPVSPVLPAQVYCRMDLDSNAGMESIPRIYSNVDRGLGEAGASRRSRLPSTAVHVADLFISFNHVDVHGTAGMISCHSVSYRRLNVHGRLCSWATARELARCETDEDRLYYFDHHGKVCAISSIWLLAFAVKQLQSRLQDSQGECDLDIFVASSKAVLQGLSIKYRKPSALQKMYIAFSLETKCEQATLDAASGNDFQRDARSLTPDIGKLRIETQGDREDVTMEGSEDQADITGDADKMMM